MVVLDSNSTTGCSYNSVLRGQAEKLEFKSLMDDRFRKESPDSYSLVTGADSNQRPLVQEILFLCVASLLLIPLQVAGLLLEPQPPLLRLPLLALLPLPPL